MRITVKLGLTALAAAIMLSSMIATASARNLSVTSTNFRVTWTSIEFASEIVTIRCRLTLEGSFHSRTIVKRPGALIGAVSRAIVAHPCTNGEFWFDNGTERAPLGTLANRLPFHLTYLGFIGRLPRIEFLILLLARFSYVLESRFIGVTCRARYGSAEDNISANAAVEAGGNITTIEPDPTRNIATRVTDLSPGIRACPSTAAFLNRTAAQVFTENGATRIRITLI